MKTTRTTTIVLSPDDLHNAVVKWAVDNGIDVKDADSAKVTINVRTMATGYGMMERNEHVGEVVLTVNQ